MFIESTQAFIFNGITEKGQICIVEPKSYKKVYVLPPKNETTIKISELKEDTKYNFVLAVIVDVKSQKASVNNKTVYLNEVKIYINDIVEYKENA